MAKLKGLIAGHGIEVHYPNDRAGIDIGLHLFAENTATQARVWFQVKGKHAATLPVDRVGESVAVSVPVGYVAYWYSHPEAAYLVVFVESLDMFLASDVRELVDAQWPEGLAGLPTDQQSVTLHVPTTALLDRGRLTGMTAHRSMRIDGPASRGRPLGHRFDPLRSRFSAPEPPLFDAVVDSLLEAHRFAPTAERTIASNLRVVRGQLHETMTWQPQLFTEIGFDSDDAVRIEGAPSAVQGDVLFVIDSAPDAVELDDAAQGALTALLEQARNDGFYVGLIANRGDTKLLTDPTWRQRIMPGLVGAAPERFIGLEAITNLVLVATLVYLDFATRLHFDRVNFVP